MDTKLRLADMPGMDDTKIGPAGETFGQLKANVLAARAAYVSALTEGRLNLHPEVGDGLDTAVSLLRTAYACVGLPYEAP